MLLIFSKLKLEPSTEDVIDWLDCMSVPWLRINGEDWEGEQSYAIRLGKKNNSAELSIGEKKISAEKIDLVWYRRSHGGGTADYLNQLSDRSLSEDLRNYLDSEVLHAAGAFNIQCGSATWIDHPSKIFVSKMKMLRIAVNCGLEIPETLVTNCKSKLLEFSRDYSFVITKSIQDSWGIKSHNANYVFYTQKLTNSVIRKQKDVFFPTLVQEGLEKQYEIRCFHLDGENYSMAIFSQLDKKTQVDFRQYNNQTPNRTVPFKLPKIIEKKINQLMNALELISGSIDIVKTIDGRYVFLEVNPVGQFGMTSIPCNYYLEKKIAEFLCKTKCEIQGASANA